MHNHFCLKAHLIYSKFVQSKYFPSYISPNKYYILKYKKLHYPNYDKRYYQSVQDVLDIKFRMISVKKLNKNYTAVNKEKGRWKKFFICHNLRFASRGID